MGECNTILGAYTKVWAIRIVLHSPNDVYNKCRNQKFQLAGRLAQLVERRTREHNVSCFGSLQVWVRIPGWPTKIINCLSDETLNRGPV